MCIGGPASTCVFVPVFSLPLSLWSDLLTYSFTYPVLFYNWYTLPATGVLYRGQWQRWQAISFSFRTVLIHLLRLYSRVPYLSFCHMSTSQQRFNQSNGQSLTVHLYRSLGHCIGCFSEKEIACYFLVVTVYLSFRIWTSCSVAWIWILRLALFVCLLACQYPFVFLGIMQMCSNIYSYRKKLRDYL